MLSSHARRDLLLHRAPCPCVSADELAMVQLVAIQQTSATDLASGLAGDLVEPEAVGPLLEVGSRLAAALGRLDLILPERQVTAAPGARPRLH